jgi:hypothetical protein
MIRFLADASLDHPILTGCIRREPSMDFLSAHAANLEGIPDSQVLSLAALEGRILISSDYRSMPSHFNNFLADGNTSPGLFLVSKQLPIGLAIDSLVLIWSASSESDRINQVRYLPL